MYFAPSLADVLDLSWSGETRIPDSRREVRLSASQHPDTHSDAHPGMDSPRADNVISIFHAIRGRSLETSPAEELAELQRGAWG